MRHISKRWLWIGVVLVLALLLYILMVRDKAIQFHTGVVSIGAQTFVVDIADTAVMRTQGLSGQAGLEQGHGLFFIFETPDKYGFWMKDMRFPIDMIWITESFEVDSVTHNAQPSSYPHVFYPHDPVQYVLEVPADDARDIQIGDKVIFTKTDVSKNTQ